MTLNEQVGKRIAELLAERRMRQTDLVQAGCAKDREGAEKAPP